MKGKSRRQLLLKFLKGMVAFTFSFHPLPFTLRAAAVSQLDLVSVTPPRIFTPNGDGCNDVITFRVLSTAGASEIRGRIFSLSREVVSELKPVALLGSMTFSPACTAPDTTPGSYFWDGKDLNGNLVPKGIYLYQIEAGDKAVRGTVVVAR